MYTSVLKKQVFIFSFKPFFKELLSVKMLRILAMQKAGLNYNYKTIY